MLIYIGWVILLNHKIYTNQRKVTKSTILTRYKDKIHTPYLKTQIMLVEQISIQKPNEALIILSLAQLSLGLFCKQSLYYNNNNKHRTVVGYYYMPTSDTAELSLFFL